MIRYAYINNQVLQLYGRLDHISFPINPKEIIKFLPNCRYMSYQQMANVCGSTIDDIVEMCESKSGCTHYNVTQKRYLILCNDESKKYNNQGRQRWTFSHEIGHIVCNHHVISAYDKLSENSLLQVKNPEFEAEADYFAATLLAPFPLFALLDIGSPLDVQNTFGLSCEASIYRFKQYMRWRDTRVKTAWENDMIRLFKSKCQIA